MAPVTPPSLWDAATLAVRLGTTERHVRELVYRRQIPFVKVGRSLRFDPRRIEAWLEQQSSEVA